MVIQQLLEILGGFLQFRGGNTADIAPANTARLWYDKATNKLKLSKNGAAFVDLEEVTTGKLDAAAVTSAKIDPTVIQVVEVAITNAQLKALRASPKTLVAAPGAGYYLEFVGATLFLDYGTNGLTESDDNLVIRYTDGSGVAVSDVIEMTGFIDQTADTATRAVPIKDAIVAKTGCDNKALVLHNNGDGEFGGNAAADTVLRVKCSWRQWPTGW